NKYNYRYKIELLNEVCYASVKAGDYKTVEKYIGIIEDENRKHPKTDFLSFKSFMAKATFLGITGKIHQSLDVLDYLELKYKKLYKTDDYLFMRLNCNKAS